VNIPKANPFLELRFAHGKKFAGSFQIDVTAEIVDPRELLFNGVAHGANQHIIWNFNAQHGSISLISSSAG
jgi:hypothetical protein